MLSDQPLPHPPRGMPLLTRHIPITDRHESTTSTHGSIAGRTRGACTFRCGGTADANAARTVRRCTPCRSANSRIDTFSIRRSRLISSNSSTLDLAISTSTPMNTT